MTRYLVLRFLRGVLTLWAVVTIVFFGLRISGDPVTLMLGFEARPEAYEAMSQKLGLDRPIAVQYLKYMQRVLQGDFGESIREKRPVIDVVGDRLPATIELAVAALLLAVLIGIPVGVLAALNRNSMADRGLMSIAFVGQSAPGFFVGIILILVFSFWLAILPSGGRGSMKHLLLPAITLSFAGVASMARLTRSSVLEVMSQDYVRTARAKGLGESRLVMTHVLRNAALPVLTTFGILVGLALSGAVVIETVFAWPGMGRLATNSVLQRDYPVIQCIVLLVAFSIVITNFVVDVLYAIIDPRIRLR